MKEERQKRRKKLLALKNRPPKILVVSKIPLDVDNTKIECEMETAKKQLVLFEFCTNDVIPEEVASQFVSDHLI